MKILKIIGLIVASCVGVFALVFFLYPYINKDNYNEIVTLQYSDASGFPMRFGEETDEEMFMKLQREIERLQSMNMELLSAMDSLELVQEDLRLEIEEWEKMEDFFPVSGGAITAANENKSTNMSDEEFSERVKSLLNLDEEELAPIVREMNQDQLTRIYHSSGSIQREKLLRSLEPRRAAELMKEVML